MEFSLIRVEELAENAVDPAKPRPGRRVPRVFLQALQVEITCKRRFGVDRHQLVRSQIELYALALAGTSCFNIRCSRVVSGSESDSTMREARSSWSLKRSPSGSCEVCDQTSVPSGRFDELRAHAKLLANPQQRAGQHNVDAGFVGDRSQILGAAGESRRDDAGSDDQRVEPERELVTASGRLKARKSVSGSERRIRNGNTMRRVVGRTRAPATPVSATSSVARRSCAIASAVW
jgi:hypothetical protein